MRPIVLIARGTMIRDGTMIKTVLRILFRPLRWVCYLALIAAIIAGLGLWLLPHYELCEPFGTARMPKCTTEWAGQLMEFSATFLLLSVFLGLPGLLAVLGFLFLAYQVFDVFTRNKDPQPGSDGTVHPAGISGMFSRLPKIVRFILFLFGTVFLVAFFGGMIGGLLSV